MSFSNKYFKNSQHYKRKNTVQCSESEIAKGRVFSRPLNLRVHVRVVLFIYCLSFAFLYVDLASVNSHHEPHVVIIIFLLMTVIAVVIAVVVFVLWRWKGRLILENFPCALYQKSPTVLAET